MIFLVSILAITILNLIFRDYLYQMSLDLIMSLQTQGRDPYLLAFFQTVKKVGSSYFIYGALILIYVFKERALAFHYTLIISSMMFFLCYLKMIIRYPRPYQYSDAIIPTSCSGQYGCPSATSIRVSTIMISLFLDFFHSRRRFMSFSVYFASLFVTVFIVVSVMCSRVFLAAHSIN